MVLRIRSGGRWRHGSCGLTRGFTVRAPCLVRGGAVWFGTGFLVPEELSEAFSAYAKLDDKGGIGIIDRVFTVIFPSASSASFVMVEGDGFRRSGAAEVAPHSSLSHGSCTTHATGPSSAGEEMGRDGRRIHRGAFAI